MDLTPNAGSEAFRQKIRSFFDNEFPKDIIEKNLSGASLTTDEIRKSEMTLGAKGWLATGWPEEFGGPGWSIEEQYIFDEELERAGVPTVTPMGVIYVGPVLYTFGTKEQQERWLPGIRSGKTGWGQGYSEPESGSDLASLQFDAKNTDDGYILNGTKIWTSAAQHADWMFLLARTDRSGKKQAGITFICAEMTDPDIKVIPIITLDGKHVLNRVEFTDVFVPFDQRIGEEGKGWEYSTYLLGHERTSYARIGGKRRMLKTLKEAASKIMTGGNQSLLEDPDFAMKFSDVTMRVDALEMTVMRILSALNDGGAPGKEASIVKILATETHQAITELYLEAGAVASARKFEDGVSPDWTGEYSFAAGGVAGYYAGRAQSIYGGTNEIQRNIIAKRVLGL